MADAAARREARRKRILENSENRLQRITGTKCNIREEKSNHNSYTPTNPQHNTEQDREFVPDTNGHPALTQPKNDLFDKLYSGDQDFLIQTLLSNNIRKRNVNGEGLSIDDSLDLTNHSARNERFSPINERHTSSVNEATNEPDDDVDTHESIGKISAEPSLFCSVFDSKLILVLLAAFVNILYLLQLQHLSGKTILAPFLALMLIRLNLADDKSGSQGGNMVFAALILCSIKPELIHNLRRVIKIFKKITEDSSIYIFSFVILHNMACSYWIDIDVTISTVDSADNVQLQ